MFRSAGRGGETVDVSESNGVRSLHLGSVTVQSAMRLAHPFDLELEYSRCMMVFAALHAAPRSVLQIGLGGGSLAKFIHARLPEARQTVVEINPRVEAAARAWFALPPDDERLETVIADGAQWLATRPHAADALLVDGFDGRAHAPELSTCVFYADCARALKPGGIFVINLWGSDPSYGHTLGQLRDAFGGRILTLKAARRSNVAVFGFDADFALPRRAEMRERAERLAPAFRFPLPEYVDRLLAENRMAGGELCF